MRKLIIIAMTLTILNSCAFDLKKTDDSISVSLNYAIYIQENEVFDIKEPHFCYFFLSSCVSCDSIKSKIELYAREHQDFYMVEAPANYKKGITREDSIGAKSIDEIKFLGFPTMIFIENNLLTEMYVGINEIVSVLF